MVVKVTEFSFSCLREWKFSLSRSDMWTTKALSTLKHPLSSIFFSPLTAKNLVDKKSDTSSNRYWRTCTHKISYGNHRSFFASSETKHLNTTKNPPYKTKDCIIQHILNILKGTKHNFLFYPGEAMLALACNS